MEAFLSSDVTLNIKMLVLNLHGSMTEMAEGGGPGGARPVSYADALSKRAGCAAADLYLSCQLHAHGRPLGLPERTCNTPGSRLRWNEWITFRASIATSRRTRGLRSRSSARRAALVAQYRRREDFALYRRAPAAHRCRQGHV